MHPQSTRIACTCEQCGKAFDCRPDRPQKYCSHACQGAAKHQPRAVTTCPVCGKVGEYRPDRPQKFCSRACANVGKPKGPGRPVTVGKIEAACPICGKVFAYYASGPRTYCSDACKGVGVNAGRRTRLIKACIVCGLDFWTIPSQPGYFCGLRCYGLWLGRKMRHVVARPRERTPQPSYRHPARGRKLPFKRRKPYVERACVVCGKHFEGPPGHTSKRKCCSRACSAALWSLTHSGEHATNWRGGYDPYYGPSWRPAMRAVRARDRVCQRCGKAPTKHRALDVHHKTPFRAFGIERHAEANDPSNLIALCATCHLLTEWETYRRG